MDASITLFQEREILAGCNLLFFAIKWALDLNDCIFSDDHSIGTGSKMGPTNIHEEACRNEYV
jgi:hypothetical protein